MKNDVLISVIIPCFNHGKYLEETLSSIEIASEKYPVEVIIVNDGSNDILTLEVFQKLEKRGYFILHQENQGLGNARNNGIKIAKGSYILPLDSDNKLKFPYLNSAIDILEDDKTVDIVYGDAYFIGEKNELWKNNPLDRKKMFFSNHIDACAVFRKAVWITVDGYANDMPYMGCEDWNFWMRCIDKGLNFYYLPKVCFEYRVLSDSMLRTTPEGFREKTFAYNVTSFPKMYEDEIRKNYNISHNIFHGNIIKKVIKLVLNHFKLYKY